MKDLQHYKIFPTHVFSFKGEDVNEKKIQEYLEKKSKEKLGRKNIIKSIKSISLKCIRIGRKGMWIKPVPSGGSTVVDAGPRILTLIKNIVSGRRLG